jgi:hypothetical protein
LIPFSTTSSVRCSNPRGRVRTSGEIPLDSSPFGPQAVLAVMKFAAGERIKDLPEVSKKIHGLSLA